MKTSVHGKDYRIDTYTGQSFTSGVENVPTTYFKIPVPAKLSNTYRKFNGVYPTPSIAVRAMLSFREKEWRELITEEEWKDLCSKFYDTLKRTPECAEERKDYKIEAAKPHTALIEHGGNLTLKEYNDMSDYDFQRKAFVQVLPKNPDQEEEDKIPLTNAPKQWNITDVDTSVKRDDPLPAPAKLDVPRCLNSAIEFLHDEAIEKYGEQTKSIVLYFDAKDPKRFCFGALVNALDCKVNPRATEILKTPTVPVWGDVKFIHKSEHLPVRNRKHKNASEILHKGEHSDSETSGTESEHEHDTEPEKVVEKVEKTEKKKKEKTEKTEKKKVEKAEEAKKSDDDEPAPPKKKKKVVEKEKDVEIVKAVKKVVGKEKDVEIVKEDAPAVKTAPKKRSHKKIVSGSEKKDN